MEIASESIKNLLVAIGVGAESLHWVLLGVYSAILILVAALSYYIVHHIVVVGVGRIVAKTSVKWDDDLFNDALLSRVCHIIPPVLLYVLLPWFMSDYPQVFAIGERALLIYIVVAAVRMVTKLLSSAYAASQHTETFKGHPMKGLTQMLKIIVWCVGAIVIISLLINKNPLIILSGLGASAAILMLVFKDSIMGLVAGVQLSANDMLKPGDWIASPENGVDGVVEDVSLTTVKVRNWDMTIVTIPPYTLVSGSFQNWRGMFDTGARRVKRSVNIDLNTVRFLTAEDLSHFSSQEWYDASNQPVRPVNLRLFRDYIKWYLTNHARVNHNMLTMVRQLQPSNHGVPIELYFFTATSAWVEYETIQAEIFDHVFAVAHDFGLRLFQSPSGLDFKEHNPAIENL
ncbi:MAG: mechanosensitive ion channel [Bacteroidales bacterium]|nr:mechanosensitive ion channel [Bacteroidales bacterium]